MLMRRKRVQILAWEGTGTKNGQRGNYQDGTLPPWPKAQPKGRRVNFAPRILLSIPSTYSTYHYTLPSAVCFFQLSELWCAAAEQKWVTGNSRPILPIIVHPARSKAAKGCKGKPEKQTGKFENSSQNWRPHLEWRPPRKGRPSQK